MKTSNPRIEMKPECRICSVPKLSVKLSFLYSLTGLIMVSKWRVGGLQGKQSSGKVTARAGVLSGCIGYIGRKLT